MREIKREYTVVDILSKFFLVLMIGFSMPSCNITKFLNEDELLVREIDINVEGPDMKVDNSALKDELKRLYKFRSNDDRRSYNYFKYKDLEDPPWIRRWLKNKRSTPPSILDSSKVVQSAEAIENYLRNKKGFHQAEVDYQVRVLHKGRRADVTFDVSMGSRYHINELIYVSKDTALTEVLKEIEAKSILKSGDPIDALTFDVEKQRLVSEFQRRGYADVNLTHVEVNGDSTELEKAWDIFFVMLPQGGNIAHKKYKIGDINVYTDFHQYQKASDLTSEYRYDKTYHKQSQEFIVRPSIINKKIFLQKYDVYNSENYYKTLRKLYNLDSYRFAKISNSINDKDSTLIDYKVFMTPQNKKWALDFGLESFFSTLGLNGQDLVGFALNAGLENRNVFGGSETFRAAINAGLEFNPRSNQQDTRLINSRSVGLNTELEIPTLTKPFNILRPIHRLGILKDRHMAKLEEEGVTDFSLGFNYLDIINTYSIFSINAGYGYDFTLNQKNKLTFNQIGFNYTDYTVPANSAFDTILASNPILRNSFDDNLFTGLLFKDLTHIFRTERGKNKSNFALISSLELSGVEVHFANKLSNLLTKSDNVWSLYGNTEFEKMVKLQIDARWYSKYRKKTQFAARLKAGLAKPFGADNNVSFVKQFFVGGPSSIRAWAPMHLGPGTFANEEFFYPKKNTIFFQRGDFVLEGSFEYRFDLLWLMEGALFVDVGNIWTISREIDNNGRELRPGSLLDLNFLDDLAVGYGYGIRFDFSYFLIRIDMGLKLRYPTLEYSDVAGDPPPTSRWIPLKGQKAGNFNIAVAYPF